MLVARSAPAALEMLYSHSAALSWGLALNSFVFNYGSDLVPKTGDTVGVLNFTWKTVPCVHTVFVW